MNPLIVRRRILYQVSVPAPSTPGAILGQPQLSTSSVTTGGTGINLSPGAGTSGITQGDVPSYIQGPSFAHPSTQLDLQDPSGTQHPMVQWSAPSQATGPGALPPGLAGFAALAQYAVPQTYTHMGVLEAFGRMSPDQKMQVQQQLYQAGYLVGAKGQKFFTDYEVMTALSNAYGVALHQQQPLDSILSSTSGIQALAAQLYQQNTMLGQFAQANPAELRDTADKVALSVLGRKATAEEKALLVPMVQAAQVQYQKGQFEEKVGAQRSDVAQQLAQQAPTGGPLGAAGTTLPGSPTDLNAFMTAIGGQESGGSYTSVNATSGASGKYQIMPGNWPSWSQAAGLGPNAPQTPANQEIVARNQMSVYYNDLKDWGAVAVAWYAGEGTAKAFLADPTNPKWQKPQGNYPSIASYAQSIVGRMNAAQGGPTTPALSAYPAGQEPGAPGSQIAGPPAPGQPGSTAPATTAALPTSAQLVPAQESVWTQVNPEATMRAELRQRNPLEASGNDFAQGLAAVHQLFHTTV